MPSYRRRRLTGCVLALLLAVTAAGCGSASPGAQEDSLAAMLELVPDTRDTRKLVIYGNLARERELLDQNDPRWIAEPIQTYDLTEEAGFELTDLDVSLQAGSPLPRTAGLTPQLLSIFTGRIDPRAVHGALTGTAPFADDVRTGKANGARTYSVGAEDAYDPGAVSALRPTGGPLRLGVQGDTLWMASTDQNLRPALRTARADGTALADDDAYIEVAGVVDEAAAFNALIFDSTAHTGPARELTSDPYPSPEMAEDLQRRIDAGKAGLAPWRVGAVADVEGELLVVDGMLNKAK